MRSVLLVFYCFCLFSFNVSVAQVKWEKCGYDIVRSAMMVKNPDFEQRLEAQLNARQKMLAAKTTKTTVNINIPVVFHFILNQQQLHQVGDSSGIAQRIITQMQVLNEDYNRGNGDSSKIPGAFKSLYGNPNIKFGLAHTDPNGNSTDGWEIKTTTLQGFDVFANSGSAAKYDSSGGTNAWDVSSYLNIWVINMLEGTVQSGVIGLTVPPSFTDSSIYSNANPKVEMGVLIRYDAFGRRTNSSEYFYPGIDLGRTTTHEIGHYFNLFHPWGDDDDDDICRCPWPRFLNGSWQTGHDDGIADTPPEGCRHYGGYTFPVYDSCSPSYPGLLFMDYMEYVDDSSMSMFTNDQAYVMDNDISIGYTHSLISHPQLLDYPGTTNPNSDNIYSLYPNPAILGRTSVNFNLLPEGFESISVYNSFGQHIMDINTSNQLTTYYPIDLSGQKKGMYFVKLHFANRTDVRKLVVL